MLVYQRVTDILYWIQWLMEIIKMIILTSAVLITKASLSFFYKGMARIGLCLCKTRPGRRDLWWRYRTTGAVHHPRGRSFFGAQQWVFKHGDKKKDKESGIWPDGKRDIYPKKLELTRKKIHYGQPQLGLNHQTWKIFEVLWPRGQAL